MKRYVALTLLIGLLASGWSGGSWAAAFSDTPTLDGEEVAAIAGVALAFMAPRILEPLPLSQLAVWGLRGLTALDPRLTPRLHEGQLDLTLASDDGERVLWSQIAPGRQDAAAWGQAVALLMRAGWDASQPVRGAGQQRLVQAFFDELCSHLDPYSRYVPPEEAAAERDARADHASIGVTLAVQGEHVVVRSVRADGPAQAAGVQAGDTLVAIDGEDVGGTDWQTAEKALDGEDGSTVLLTLRGADGSEHERSVERMAQGSGGVTFERSGAVLLIRIPFFSGSTGRGLVRAISSGLTARVRGVVLDVRGNRGGLLRQAVAATDALLASGVVVETTGRDPQANETFRAEGADAAHGLPAVVLVDGRTASAAEIFAAALADQHRAVVVGSATLGKGLVQAVAPLPDGGALYVTWSRVLAPLGWPIQTLGVLPQVCTSAGRELATRQLAELASGRQPMAGALERSRSARVPLPTNEALAIRAACPAAQGLEFDSKVARILVEGRTAYETALLGPAGDEVVP